jgi:hypothetical protein
MVIVHFGFPFACVAGVDEVPEENLRGVAPIEHALRCAEVGGNAELRWKARSRRVDDSDVAALHNEVFEISLEANIRVLVP